MEVADSFLLACNLKMEDLPGRLALIRRVTTAGLLSHNLDAQSLRLVYRKTVLEELRTIVEAEQECCAFLTFALTVNATEAALTITASPERRDSARWLFAQFLPGPVEHGTKSCGCSPGICGR